MFPYILILLAFAADRLSKQWAATYLAENGPTQVHSLLTLYPTYNQGIAFGLLQGIGSLVGWLSIAIVIGLFFYLVRVPRSQWLLRIGLALIIGGAMGNLLDRVTAGQVLDFIQTPIRPGIFNVADILINVGVVLSLLGALLQKRAPKVSQQVLEVEEQAKP
jgi:signal peptidase II